MHALDQTQPNALARPATRFAHQNKRVSTQCPTRRNRNARKTRRWQSARPRRSASNLNRVRRMRCDANETQRPAKCSRISGPTAYIIAQLAGVTGKDETITFHNRRSHRLSIYFLCSPASKSYAKVFPVGLYSVMSSVKIN